MEGTRGTPRGPSMAGVAPFGRIDVAKAGRAGSGAVRPRLKGRVSAVVLPAVGTVLVVGLWWLATIVFEVESFVLPAPPEVAEAFDRLGGYLIENLWVTLAETLQGFALATVLGLLLGLLITSSWVVEQMLYPLLLAINAIPKPALAPLLVIWMGFGPEPKIVMVVLICFFPIVLAAATGLASTPADHVELVRSLDASRWQIFRKVRLPSALPQIFIGLKAAMPLAVIGAVIGELVAADAGLGFVINQAGGSADTALAFAAIALLGLMAIVLFYALVAIERLLLPWVRQTTA